MFYPEIAKWMVPPRGSMHLCYVDDEVVGIIALTDFDGKRGEMKRLYVKPQYRGKGIARKLSEIIIWHRFLFQPHSSGCGGKNHR